MPEYNSQKAGPGVVIFCAVVALVFMVLMVGGLPFLRTSQKKVTIYFDSVSGVKERTVVTYAGHVCGEVKSLVSLEKPKERDGRLYHVEVVAEIDPRIPVNSMTKAQITLVGMLGDKELDLLPGPEAPPLDGPIYGASGGLDILINTARQMALKLEPLLDDIQKMAANFNEVMDSPAVKDDIKATIAQARKTLARSESTLARLDDLLRENHGGLKAFFDDARGLSGKGSAAFDTVNGAVTETNPKLQAMIGDVQRLVNELRPKLDKLMDKTGVSLDKADAAFDKTGSALDKAGAMFESSSTFMSDNKENIVLLIDSLRQTSYNAKHFTHTFRWMLSPWSVFSSQEPPEPRKRTEPRLGPVADPEVSKDPSTTKLAGAQE